MICHICRSGEPRKDAEGILERVWAGISLGGGAVKIDAHPYCIAEALAFVGKLMRRESDPKRIAAIEELKKIRDKLVQSPLSGSEEVPDGVPECTGTTAVWCPICGDCSCKRDESGEFPEGQEDDSCPLHSKESAHGVPR